MIVTGTMNTLTTKMQFTSTSINADGKEATFSKPWFGTFNMVLAMMLVGLVDKTVRSTCVKPSPPPDAAYVPLGDSAGPSYNKKVALVAIPAAFDVLATAMCCMGMLYIPASVWQMLRGSAIVFCALLSVCFLKRKLYAFNWIGLVIAVFGITMVGLSNILSNGSDESSSNSSDVAELTFGMTLVISGMVVQAGQVIAEEWLMKDVDLPAMQIVGWEGAWGTLIMIVIVYPLLYTIPGDDHGHLEDVYDTFVMVKNSTPLLILVLVYLFSCGTFNASGIAVTGALTAVHRMMLDASRTMVIWAFGLAVGHISPSSPFGEQWTPYSYLQLVGFVILVLGQGIYGEIIKVPGIWYPPPQAISSFASPGSLQISSPLPRDRDQ